MHVDKKLASNSLNVSAFIRQPSPKVLSLTWYPAKSEAHDEEEVAWFGCSLGW